MSANGRPLIPYLRQSRAKERTISIEEQRRDIRRWADANGVALAPEIVEQNVSGNKPWRLRGLGEAIDTCERGEAAGIVVAWQDRLSRENGRATAEVWEALEQAGARLVCVGDGLDTADGRDHEMLFTIKAAIAREQWKRSRANFEQARRRSVEHGVFPSGIVPTGYRKEKGKQFEIDRRQAAKVSEAFERRARGEPISAIARRLGWADSTTRQILANPVYLGTLRHGGFVKENAHPAIVSRELFDAVQATRTTIPVPPGQTTAGRLLIGLARCAGCGRTLKTVRRKRADGSFVVSYFCKDAASERCPARAYVHADELDSFVVEWFEQALRSRKRMVDVVAAGRDLHAAQLALERAKKQLNVYVEETEINDPVLFQRGLDARRKRVADAEERVRHLAARLGRLPAGGSLSALWERFDPLRRRAVLASFIDRVEVERGASADLRQHVRVRLLDDVRVLRVVDEEAGVREVAA